MRRLFEVLTVTLVVNTCAWGQGLFTPLLTPRPMVSVAPQPASPLDEMSVAASYWAPTGGYHINQATMQVQDNIIRLNLDWHVNPGVFVTQVCCWASGKVSIGKWPRGTYTVLVTNNGQDGGSTTFVVGASVSISPSTPTAWSFVDLFNRSGTPGSGGAGLAERLRRALYGD